MSERHAVDTTRPLAAPGEFLGAADHAYLDTANIALTYSGAVDTVADWYRAAGRGGSLYFDAEAERAVFLPLRRAAARLLGVSADDIAAGSSSTELLGSLAWALAPAAECNVVSTQASFPSTVYPWRRVADHTGCDVRLAPVHDGLVDEEEIIRLIDERTAIVCLSHAEYATGQLYDLVRIAAASHAHGALLVVDAMQTAGALQIHAPSLGIDALVCGAYKWLCGPFGAAFLYLTPELQASNPGLVGFRSHHRMWDLRADRLTLPSDASRFEASTTAFGAALGLAASIDYLVQIGVERIEAHNRALAEKLRAGLQERGIAICSPGRRARTSIVLMGLERANPQELVDALAASRIQISPRETGVRVSPHLYNDSADIDRLLDRLDRHAGI